MDLFIKNDPQWCFSIKTFNILNPHLSERNFRTKNIDSVLNLTITLSWLSVKVYILDLVCIVGSRTEH